jgi:hypothetical protein
MPRKRKHLTIAAPALGAAGLTLSMVGGASAAAVPGAEAQPTPNFTPSHQVTLGEQEIADVSLATFYVFDKESTAAAKDGIQLARGGCGGHGGCGGRGCGGRGCGGRGCGGRGCGGCGGCACGCISWGACRLC